MNLCILFLTNFYSLFSGHPEDVYKDSQKRRGHFMLCWFHNTVVFFILLIHVLLFLGHPADGTQEPQYGIGFLMVCWF
jgi:hypothetical protein